MAAYFLAEQRISRQVEEEHVKENRPLVER
jgi:hypothetical protein